MWDWTFEELRVWRVAPRPQEDEIRSKERWDEAAKQKGIEFQIQFNRMQRKTKFDSFDFKEFMAFKGLPHSTSIKTILI